MTVVVNYVPSGEVNKGAGSYSLSLSLVHSQLRSLHRCKTQLVISSDVEANRLTKIDRGAVTTCAMANDEAENLVCFKANNLSQIAEQCV